MAGKTVELETLLLNAANPRFIREPKFKKLVENIRKYPKLLELRPIVIRSWEDRTVLGGNMRTRALNELGYTEIPREWVRTADQLTKDEMDAFLILDNVGFGEWDNDILANNWDLELLDAWGVDIPKLNTDEMFDTADEQDESGYDQQPQWFLNIRCASEQECQRLYEKFIAEGLDVKIVL